MNSPPRELHKGLGQSEERASREAWSYNIFWYDQNINNEQNQNILETLRIIGFKVFAFESIEDGQQIVDEYLDHSISSKNLQSLNFLSNSTMDWDTIVITSGSYKDQVISKFIEYNKLPELQDRFKKIMIFCANVHLHLFELDNKEYGHYIHTVIS